MRKCENCGYLQSEGYEYPEYYCAAGVSEDDERYNGEGCSYHWKTLKKKYNEICELEAESYYIPLCSDCLYYPKCKDIEEQKKKADGFNFVCDDFRRADKFIEVKSCSDCFWQNINRKSKCVNCIRNGKIKDKYWRDEKERTEGEQQ